MFVPWPRVPNLLTPNYIVCLFDGVQRHFQQYLSYIVAVSFNGVGNRRNRRKPIHAMI
jgi:hypothetical protein